MTTPIPGNSPKPIDPEDVFITALMFDASAGVLSNQVKDSLKALQPNPQVGQRHHLNLTPKGLTRVPTLFPFVCVGAFAMELYLKCLHYLTTGSVPHAHDLLKLYDQLPDTERNKLRQYHDENVAKFDPDRGLDLGVPTDIRTELGHAANFFVTMRYAFEDELKGKGSLTLGLTRSAACRLILELRPDWQAIHDTTITLPVFPPTVHFH